MRFLVIVPPACVAIGAPYEVQLAASDYLLNLPNHLSQGLKNRDASLRPASSLQVPVYDALNCQLDALGMSGSAEPLSHELQQPLPLLANIEVAAGQ